MSRTQVPELICPAGSLPALKAAVDHGADAVYLGYRDDTNARNFAGLNFDHKAMVEGIRYAHSRQRKVLMAINTFAQPGRVADWQRAVDGAADLGVDAVILADVGLLDYASSRHPDLRLHLSVQGSATSYEAVNFAHREFGIRRAVLPRVLTLAQLIDRFGDDEPAGYPTLCKGRFEVNGDTYYALEEPTSLNVLEVLPQIAAIGVAAIKVEGRQRSPTYVAQVTRALRAALDELARSPGSFSVKPTWQAELAHVSEGSQVTLGAYNRPWR